MTERGAAPEAGGIEAVVAVALLSQWLDGAPRGYLKRNINTNIMQQGVGVDTPTVIVPAAVVAVVEAVAVVAVEQGRTTTAGVCGPECPS